MTAGYQALTEKEKQTLRLIVRGHDAKSTARTLGLSVHTVNERLREARRKLSVSSSREAARLVLAAEGDAPQMLGDSLLGADPAPATTEDGASPGHGWPGLAGVLVMSLVLGTLAFTLAPQAEAPPPSKTAQVAALEAEVTEAARAWLALGDAGQWDAAYRATTEQFRTLNTAETWARVSQEVRAPLGAMLAREALTHDSVPAPPAGVEVVRFRTDFANRQDVIETVSLARENGAWKVVGIYLE